MAKLIDSMPAVPVLPPRTAPCGAGAVSCAARRQQRPEPHANSDPNLTYVGSLVTLLWRRIVRDHDTDV
ncbi:hypothetical protein ACWD4T_22255 [Streptomyces umbrinus]